MSVGWIVLAGIAAAPFLREALRKPMDAHAREQAPGKFAELTDGVTHYRWIGPVRGPVAVCIHGLTTPSMVWQQLADDLAGLGFRVLVYDLYGRGYSDRLRGTLGRDLFQRQLKDLLAHEGVGDDITLLGYSMGGSIGTAFAAENPGRLRRLILLAPAGIETALVGAAKLMRDVPVLGDWLALALFARAHRKSTEAERAANPEVSDIVDYQQEELGKKGFVPAVLGSLRGALAERLEADHREISRADVPVLAIWGKEDSLIPLRAMGTLAQWNRAARQEVIEGAGHGLPYTHGHEVAAVIRTEVSETGD